MDRFKAFFIEDFNGAMNKYLTLVNGSFAAALFDNSKKILDYYGRYKQDWWHEMLVTDPEIMEYNDPSQLLHGFQCAHNLYAVIWHIRKDRFKAFYSEDNKKAMDRFHSLVGGSFAATLFDNNKKMLDRYGRYEESWWLEKLSSQDAPDTDMFDLCEGSVLTILSDCGDGLLLVRTDSGKTGYVQNAVCFW